MVSTPQPPDPGSPWPLPETLVRLPSANTATPAIEGYYIESTDGLLFAVKGLVHPPEMVVAYLRYVPDPNGERERNGRRYRRFYRFDEQERLLHTQGLPYLFDDPILGERIQGVPREYIRKVYDPCLRMAELRGREILDGLEREAVQFADLLVERAGVPERSTGISGSILVGLHTAHSDLDIVIYGSEHCRRVHKALQQMLDDPESVVKRLNEHEMRGLYISRSQDTPMSFDDFIRLESRKVIQGKFWDQEYFIRFVKSPAEVGEKYGEKKYRSLGEAQIEAPVTDANGAIFTPCTYIIADIRFIEGSEVNDLKEIVSFRGRFCEQAREGERVIARGKLEMVDWKGEVYHRLVLGRPGDFMVPVRTQR